MVDITRIDCRSPLLPDGVRNLRAGDSVELTGQLLTLRDATAQALSHLIERGDPLPIDLEGRLLYAAGPSPAKPGQVIGSAGPTTTERIARFLPALFERGARGIIGKGELHGDDAALFARYGTVYFAAVGGLGALLGKQIVAADIVAYPELGTEAIYRFEVRDFPVVVAIDVLGENLHERARIEWRRSAPI